MDQTNLDIYGHAPLPWSRAADQLDAAVGQNVTHFLATVRRDGRPHVAGVGALWVDGKFYFVSGAGTRKSRNLAEKADCVISVKLPELDLVVAGAATKVTDEPTLQRLAARSPRFVICSCFLVFGGLTFEKQSGWSRFSHRLGMGPRRARSVRRRCPAAHPDP